MLLKPSIRIPLPTGSSRSRRAERSRLRNQWRAGQAHHCGLLHRSGLDSWSPMAALLWWLLR
jgi:hypothetical protein